jgi:hypothetical protein
MFDSSLTQNKIKMQRLPPLKLNLSNTSRNSFNPKLKNSLLINKTAHISSHTITCANPSSYKTKKIYNYRLKGMFSFTDKERLEFKSKAEKYVESLLNEDNSNANRTHNTEQDDNVAKDNYQKLIDPFEKIKEKHMFNHYSERLKGINLNKKKTYNEIISNYSINNSVYRKVAPHGVVPRKDVLTNMKTEMDKNEHSLKPFTFKKGLHMYKKEKKKILTEDNSNYEETMFYLKQLYKPDFEQRFQGTVSMANNFLKEMKKREEETNQRKEMINQVG